MTCKNGNCCKQQKPTGPVRNIVSRVVNAIKNVVNKVRTK